MDGTISYLELIPSLLRLADKQVADFIASISGFNPYFPLPWVLTLFSHDYTPYSARIVDLMLASDPLMPIYLSTAAALSRKEQLLQLENEMPPVHNFLSVWPSWIPVEYLLRRAREIHEQSPPDFLLKFVGPERHLGSYAAPLRYEKDVVNVPYAKHLDLSKAKKWHLVAPKGRRKRQRDGWGLGIQAEGAVAVGVLGMILGALYFF